MDTGTGTPDPHFPKGMKINHKKIHQSTNKKTGLFFLLLFIFFKKKILITSLNFQTRWLPRRVKRSLLPWERRRPCASSNSRTTKKTTETPSRAEPEMTADGRAAPARRPAANPPYTAPGGSAPAGGAKPAGSGLSGLLKMKRAASPSSHGSAKRSHAGSLSSSSTARTSNFLPPLYYTTLNKRENAITPRVMGGGGKSSC